MILQKDAWNHCNVRQVEYVIIVGSDQGYRRERILREECHENLEMAGKNCTKSALSGGWGLWYLQLCFWMMEEHSVGLIYQFHEASAHFGNKG
jgi:hypothetical protein